MGRAAGGREGRGQAKENENPPSRLWWEQATLNNIKDDSQRQQR